MKGTSLSEGLEKGPFIIPTFVSLISGTGQIDGEFLGDVLSIGVGDLLETNWTSRTHLKGFKFN